MLEHNHAGSRCRVYRERLLHCSSRRTLCLFTAVFIACLAACGGSTKPTVPGPPPGTQHLYTNGATGHARSVRATPLRARHRAATLSIPTASDVSALAVDSAGNVAVGASGGSISIFNAPISSSASPSVTFQNGTSTFVENLAFNSAGDLFATTNSNSINVFTHPLTSASTPSQVITSVNLTISDGLALDSANNLIVTNTRPARPAATCWFTLRLTPASPSQPPRSLPLPIAKWRSAARSYSLSTRRSAYQKSTFTICRSPRPARPHF